MDQRVVIARSIYRFKDELFFTGITNSRRHEIWQQVCDDYKQECAKKIDIMEAKRTWNNMRVRALKLDENEQKKHEITNVSFWNGEICWVLGKLAWQVL